MSNEPRDEDGLTLDQQKARYPEVNGLRWLRHWLLRRRIAKRRSPKGIGSKLMLAAIALLFLVVLAGRGIEVLLQE